MITDIEFKKSAIILFKNPNDEKAKSVVLDFFMKIVPNLISDLGLLVSKEMIDEMSEDIVQEAYVSIISAVNTFIDEISDKTPDKMKKYVILHIMRDLIIYIHREEIHYNGKIDISKQYTDDCINAPRRQIILSVYPYDENILTASDEARILSRIFPESGGINLNVPEYINDKYNIRTTLHHKIDDTLPISILGLLYCIMR